MNLKINCIKLSAVVCLFSISIGTKVAAQNDDVAAPKESSQGSIDISEEGTWNSQVTDLIYLKESDIVMALCDQWWIPNKKDINQSRYLFLPIHMDEKTGEPKMTFLKKWDPLKPTE